jgi:hypothetical protein
VARLHFVVAERLLAVSFLTVVATRVITGIQVRYAEFITTTVYSG